MPIADPRNRARFPRQETAMMHCDLRVRWKVASDLRFRAAISEPKTPSCCRISGDVAKSTRKSLALSRRLAATESIAVQWVLMAPPPDGFPLLQRVRAHCSPICLPEEWTPLFVPWVTTFVGGAIHELNPFEPHLQQRNSKITVCSRKPATQR